MTLRRSLRQVWHPLHSNSAFSLIEMLCVCTIIGILTSLATPGFRSFQAKARQAECKSSLSQIHELATAYFVERNAFTGAGSATTLLTQNNVSSATSCVTVNGMGFVPADCTRMSYYYGFTIPTPTTFSARCTEVANPYVTGTAAGERRVYPGCSVPTTVTNLDTWTMNQDRNLSSVYDSTILCR